MGKEKPTKDARLEWRNLLSQAIALIEDQVGVPYEESVLRNRWIKFEQAQLINKSK